MGVPGLASVSFMTSRELIDFIRRLYGRPTGVIPLHAPVFPGREKEYLRECIDSTFVSSVGPFVNRFERMLTEITGARFAVATVNGTSALHVVLRAIGVGPGDLVLTQPLSFIATCNAIVYCGAKPFFLDIDTGTLGLDPDEVESFLATETEPGDRGRIHRATGARIAACVPMHTFGHPCRIGELVSVCRKYGIPVIEDAAEALGSSRQGCHCGTLGLAGVLSFNGNKIITCGGGGAVLTDDPDLAKRVRFLSTTAKEDHPYRYHHPEVGYNYRMAGINAALGCAQLENLDRYLVDKRKIARSYMEFFADNENGPCRFVREPDGCRSNYWLNSVILADRADGERLLRECNQAGIHLRPAWELLHRLPPFGDCGRGSLARAEDLAPRLINLPSGVRERQ